MDKTREKELRINPNAPLSQSEIQEGWRWVNGELMKVAVYKPRPWDKVDHTDDSL